jgi:hypothetical protein
MALAAACCRPRSRPGSDLRCRSLAGNRAPLPSLLIVLALAGHAETVSYWIAPGPDAKLAEWALAAWRKASDGKLEFKPMPKDDAQMRIVWATAEEGMYGEARSIFVNGHRAVDVYVRPAPLETSDGLLRDAITYLTCVHETGHALGLSHTAKFADIMYSFQFGGDIREYFARYRRKLRSREDIRNNSGLSEDDRAQLEKALRR